MRISTVLLLIGALAIGSVNGAPTLRRRQDAAVDSPPPDPAPVPDPAAADPVAVDPGTALQGNGNGQGTQPNNNGHCDYNAYQTDFCALPENAGMGDCCKSGSQCKLTNCDSAGSKCAGKFLDNCNCPNGNRDSLCNDDLRCFQGLVNDGADWRCGYCDPAIPNLCLENKKCTCTGGILDCTPCGDPTTEAVCKQNILVPSEAAECVPVCVDHSSKYPKCGTASVDGTDHSFIFTSWSMATCGPVKGADCTSKGGVCALDATNAPYCKCDPYTKCIGPDAAGVYQVETRNDHCEISSSPCTGCCVNRIQENAKLNNLPFADGANPGGACTDCCPYERRCTGTTYKLRWCDPMGYSHFYNCTDMTGPGYNASFTAPGATDAGSYCYGTGDSSSLTGNRYNAYCVPCSTSDPAGRVKCVGTGSSAPCLTGNNGVPGWGDAAACPTAYPTCLKVNGLSSCVATVCTPGAHKCSGDGKTLYTCTSAGQWAPTACTGAKLCNLALATCK